MCVCVCVHCVCALCVCTVCIYPVFTIVLSASVLGTLPSMEMGDI